MQWSLTHWWGSGATKKNAEITPACRRSPLHVLLAPQQRHLMLGEGKGRSEQAQGARLLGGAVSALPNGGWLMRGRPAHARAGPTAGACIRCSCRRLSYACT